MYHLNLFLVRHGEDEDNAKHIINGHRETGLTVLGRKQAKEAGERLRDEKIEVFYSSPLRRAVETAQIIKEVIDRPNFNFKTFSLLAERDFGILTGKEEKEKPKYASHLLAWDGAVHFWGVKGEENFPKLLIRAQRVLSYMERCHYNKTILLVAHFEIGKMIEAAYYGWSWQRALKTPFFKNGEIIRL
ncbi:histidine phosphatase family protein [Candidatus Shapirobacteria bacterium CG09_land_8_20_14_0_10_38_17]|uniref:Histidine phosphatase family protein n=1 Tax=Candidatus Shapirobacteria bacterium CG09_land_8_20_14_0_10_38_17 TaxID=1974884 RepID=A0A2H0WR53_9BACT|nr:MAG: histidine phosphatase family protein [Candidatus Shapirobacteria bacterium CG09_land_8_20_14_0_10_38_17]